MMPPLLRAVACCLTVAMGVPAITAADAPTASGGVHYVEGKASAPDGQAMYVESHWMYSDKGNPSRLVLYRCPDGKPFARKTLHDDGDAQAPNFTMDDARSGYLEGVRPGNGRRVVFVRDSTAANERTATLDTSPMPVIDAGFDAYIRNHWDQLGKNGSSTIPFLVPSRLDTLKFSVKREDDTQIDGRAARQYRLGLDNIIGFALPHLDVAYDAKTRELLSFKGIANVRSSKGKNVDANIVFDPSKNKDVALADLQSAATEPLNGQCKIL